MEMPNDTLSAPKYLLLYSVPVDKKADFLRFVTDGQKKSDGTFEKDPVSGAKMTGVVAWLRQNHLFDTKIYTVEKPDGSLTFIATGNTLLPDWADIPGFQSRFGLNTRMQIRDDLNALIASPQH
jgi:hypothetical protein